MICVPRTSCCFKNSDDCIVICWSSSKQQTVAMSWTEAEYMSTSLASQECVYLLSLVKSLGLDLDGRFLLQRDNHLGTKLAQNPITHSRSKHIDNKYQFVLNVMARGGGGYPIAIFTNRSEHSRFFD